MASLPAHRLKQLEHWAGRLSRPLGIVLSLALLVVVVRQASNADWSVLRDGGRLTTAFWATLVASYFISPCTELIIYSRLWGFDRAAFPALLRKVVSNELLMDYLGDVQFLAWAKSHHAGTIAPFAAVKDVSVLSALTGNLLTLILTALAWPYLAEGFSGTPAHAILASLALVVAISTGLLMVGRRIFSHRPATLAWIGALLALRTIGGLGLGVILWHVLMPLASLQSLFVLATFRMIVSRLPLVPSKEMLFAGLAVLTFGAGNSIAAATAMIASLVLLMHLAIGSLLAVGHVASVRRRR